MMDPIQRQADMQSGPVPAELPGIPPKLKLSEILDAPSRTVRNKPSMDVDAPSRRDLSSRGTPVGVRRGVDEKGKPVVLDARKDPSGPPLVSSAQRLETAHQRMEERTGFRVRADGQYATDSSGNMIPIDRIPEQQIPEDQFERLFWKHMPPEMRSLCFNRYGGGVEAGSPTSGSVAMIDEDGIPYWRASDGLTCWSGVIWFRGEPTETDVDGLPEAVVDLSDPANISGRFVKVSLLTGAWEWAETLSDPVADEADYEYFWVADLIEPDGEDAYYVLNSHTVGDIRVGRD